MSIKVYSRVLIFTICLIISNSVYSYDGYSIVEVIVSREGGGSFKGEGFYIDKDLILTSYHIIKNRDKGKPIVIISRGNIITVVNIEKTSYDKDLVILRVNEFNKPLKLCNTVNYGDSVYLILYKNGKYYKKLGKINNIRGDFIISSIRTMPGYSGVPIFKNEGSRSCVVGIHSLSGSRHISFKVIKRIVLE